MSKRDFQRLIERVERLETTVVELQEDLQSASNRLQFAEDRGRRLTRFVRARRESPPSSPSASSNDDSSPNAPHAEVVNETSAEELVNKLVRITGGRDTSDFRGYEYRVISSGSKFCHLRREVDGEFVGKEELRKASSSLALVEEVANCEDSDE